MAGKKLVQIRVLVEVESDDEVVVPRVHGRPEGFGGVRGDPDPVVGGVPVLSEGLCKGSIHHSCIEPGKA